MKDNIGAAAYDRIVESEKTPTTLGVQRLASRPHPGLPIHCLLISLYTVLTLIFAVREADAKPPPDPTALEVGLGLLQDGKLRAARQAFSSVADPNGKKLGMIMWRLADAFRWYSKKEPPILAGQKYFQSVSDLWSQVQDHDLAPQIWALLPEIRSRLLSDPASSYLRVLLCHLRMLSNERSTDGETIRRIGRAAAKFDLPHRLLDPVAQYTEAARSARTQGVVISQTIIDSEGCVVSAKTLKGLPLGLTESVQKALVWWVFEPARTEEGPTAVYYNFTTNFRLQ